MRHAFLQLLDKAVDLVVRNVDIEPVVAIDLEEVSLGDLRTFGQFLRSFVGDLTDHQTLETQERILFDNTHLVSQIRLVTFELVINDLLGAFIAFNAFTCKDLNLDHGARHTGGNAQAGVFYIRGFFTKDGTQQLFFRCQLGLSFGRNLANKHITGLNLGTNINNA